MWTLAHILICILLHLVVSTPHNIESNNTYRKSRIYKTVQSLVKVLVTRIWANAECDGCHAEYRW